MDSEIYTLPKKYKRNMIILISLSGFFLLMWIIFIILYVDAKKSGDDDKKEDYTPLTLWNDLDAKNKLIEFMKKISNSHRIAVFDLDGTLFQETDLTYDDQKLYYHRVYNDPNFTPNEEQKKIADQIKTTSENGTLPEKLNMEIPQTYGQLFNSMYDFR